MNKKSIIGIDLGGTKLSIGKVEKSRIVRDLSRKIPSQETEERIVHEIIQAVEEVFDQDVAGIGVGVPSVVDVEKGIVYDVQNIPSWKEVPLKEILENHFQRPVYINNDANCFAVGEKYFGKGKKYKNLVGVTLGTGMGSGIIIDNKLYCGANCGAGEFGAMFYKDSVLEYYCSGQFFSGEHGIRGDEAYARARKGDKTTLGIFEQFGFYVGEAMMIILFAVDPEAIIIGGSVARSFSFFKDSMWERIKAFPSKRSVERLVIEVSEKPQIALLGAAALYYDAQSR